MNRRRAMLTLLLGAGCLLALPGVATADRALPPASERTTYAQIEGTGSTWSELIVQQWIADVVLRVVPGGLREASLALGASRWRTVWCVVLPTARPGLATAVILGVARGVGETSPVLLTSGAAAFMVTNPTDGVMNSLPLFIYSNVRSGEPVAIERAFAAATALLAIVLILFVIARLLARPSRAGGSSLSRLRSSSRSRGQRRDSRTAEPVDLVHADPAVEIGPVQAADPGHETYPTNPTRESL